jgi:hypothetical protein
MDVHAIASSAGLDEAAAAQLDAFRRWLIGELVNVGGETAGSNPAGDAI